MSPSPQTLTDLEDGRYVDAQQIKISSGISTLPSSLLSLHASLTHLDLSGNTALSTLPSSISRLRNLKIAFFTNCSFGTFPVALGSCLNLEMVAFKNNGMTSIPENSLPPRLRWLILTGNEIAALPQSIGKCARLEKCMLAGNRLTALPDEMRLCRKLGLLRLSCNQFEGLPGWLWELPELAFLSWAGNPCSEVVGEEKAASSSVTKKTSPGELEQIPWSDLTVHELLGKGASGIISTGTWRQPLTPSDVFHQLTVEDTEKEVAIKLFHGTLTSDGSPLSEMNTCIAAGAHTNLISPLGTITSHPSSTSGLVLELIPPHFTNLGLPPNFATCTRDNFSADIKGKMSLGTCKNVLEGIASAGQHLHSRGVSHGDLYAHNILVDLSAGKGLLGDFGAGTVYGGESGGVGGKGRAERLDVLAFGHLLEDLVGCVEWSLEEEAGLYLEGLIALWKRCVDPVVVERPLFGEVVRVLERLSNQSSIDIDTRH